MKLIQKLISQVDSDSDFNTNSIDTGIDTLDIVDYTNSEYDISSQHDMIFFSIARESDLLTENSVYVCQYNFEKADWKSLIEDILAKQDSEEFS